MANYQYDQGGSMAAYFLITVLLLVLVPLSLSLSVTSSEFLFVVSSSSADDIYHKPTGT
jgi:preprotein translocase subunit Sec63